MSSNFPRTLKEQRRLKGWTQGELAERAGMDQTYVSKLEQGKRPPAPSTVTKLAKALGVERSALVGTTEESYSTQVINRKLKGLSPETLDKIEMYIDDLRHRRR